MNQKIITCSIKGYNQISNLARLMNERMLLDMLLLLDRINS